MNSTIQEAPRLRLLIADDDLVVQSMLDLSLSEDFEVLAVASDGEEAAELAQLYQPDAALVDLEMPGGGGLCAVRGIRKSAPDTAIVMLSGDESDGVVRELMREGVSAYLLKGVGQQVLTDTLMDAVEARASERLAGEQGQLSHA
jgi:DNA-binding NarL/FixJ family response regulator